MAIDDVAERRERRPLRVAVSGSFRRHLGAIQDAVATAIDGGSTILSPADPRIVDAFGEFVFVSSDLRRSIKGVQNRHLEAIRHSDFVWLVCPDGYVGASAAMEVGFATAVGVPVYCDIAPSDWTLRQYVTPVGTLAAAARAALPAPGGASSAESDLGLLVAPEASLVAVRAELERIEDRLLTDRKHRADDPVEEAVKRVRRIMAVPGAT